MAYLRQAESPPRGAYSPSEHGVHVCRPSEAATSPAVQFVQELWPEPENLPALHCEQALRPGCAVRSPESQSRHTELASVATNLPASQGLHVVVPRESWKRPLEQPKQAVVAVRFAKVPSAHGEHDDWPSTLVYEPRPQA